MNKESTILKSIESSQLSDTGIGNEIKYILDKTGALQLAINYQYLLNEKFLGNSGNGDLVVYLDSKTEILRFGVLEEGPAGFELGSTVDNYTIFEKAVETMEKTYGRLVRVRLTFHFESGFMVFIPEPEDLSEEEMNKLFEDSLIFTKPLLRGLLFDSEEKGPKGLRTAKELYGDDFALQLEHFNIPLWVENKEDDIFFEQKVKISHGLLNSLDQPNLLIKSFPEIEELSPTEYDVRYKPARVMQKKYSRRNLLSWKFIPYSTLERIGVNRIEDLVEMYL